MPVGFDGNAEPIGNDFDWDVEEDDDFDDV